MAHVLIIGAGGVGNVTAQKCAQNREVFEQITLASRNRAKCDAIAQRCASAIDTAEVDADDKVGLVRLIERVKPDLVVHLALPYQDLTIMDACLETGVHYLDTANYEPPDTAHFEYSWQWKYQEAFEKAGLMALLGCGFDPGVTNAYTAYARKHELDTIDKLDIIDANAGDHGQPFATNFNPEVNIREVTANGRYYRHGQWVQTEPLEMKKPYALPEGLGNMNLYLMYHEELESLVKHFPEIKQARFWMSFSDNYLRYLEVLQNVGMTRIDPVLYEGKEIVPLQFLKAVLPNPAELGQHTKGKACIGCRAEGQQDGNPKTCYIYNSCDHQTCFEEVGSQAVSYTTGVPAMVGARMMLRKTWQGSGVFNVEQLDPDPFLEDLSQFGLPWKITYPQDTFE